MTRGRKIGRGDVAARRGRLESAKVSGGHAGKSVGGLGAVKESEGGSPPTRRKLGKGREK